MHASAVHPSRIAPSARASSVVTTLVVDECVRDMPRVAIPRPEIHIAVRFGPVARRGLDGHALGGKQSVTRKIIRGGQRTVIARLRLGAHHAVLGVSASELAGRIVALEDLWGDAATDRFLDRLAHARDGADAAAIVQSAIAERAATAVPSAHSHLVLDAARRLTTTPVNAVALDLGVSERHLRRVFHEAVGVSPKTYAKLARFERALRAAREDRGASWASIAAASGYYDQAHLIAEFRGITGVTPPAFVGELRGAI